MWGIWVATPRRPDILLSPQEVQAVLLDMPVARVETAIRVWFQSKRNK